MKKALLGLFICIFFAGSVLVAKRTEVLEKPIDLAKYKFPKVNGNIVKACSYADVTGENLILLTETDFVTKTDKYENEVRSKELFAYRYLVKKGGAHKQVWRVTDFVRDCDLDGMTVSFIADAFRVTDLNKNGEAEIWMAYILNCAGDPGPMDMKIIMYEGGKKYAVRGTTRSAVSENNYAGGEYTLDAAFASGPAVFTAFAKELWEKYKNQY